MIAFSDDAVSGGGIIDGKIEEEDEAGIIGDRKRGFA